MIEWLDLIKDLVIIGYTAWKWRQEWKKDTRPTKKRSRPSKRRKR